MSIGKQELLKNIKQKDVKSGRNIPLDKEKQ